MPMAHYGPYGSLGALGQARPTMDKSIINPLGGQPRPWIMIGSHNRALWDSEYRGVCLPTMDTIGPLEPWDRLGSLWILLTMDPLELWNSLGPLWTL